MTRPLMTQADRTDVFRGLAHPLRRQVLAMLRRRQRTVGDILSELAIAMPTLSAHLAVLRETGLVRQRKVGPYRYYRLHLPTLRRAQRWLQRHT